MVRDIDKAKDIVQQAFISMWSNLQAGRTDTGTRAYLYRSVYNRSLDVLKHQLVKKKHVRDMLAAGIHHAEPHTVETRELERKINESLAQLPEKCRKIFMMSRFEQLTYREIATVLSLSEKTVENQVGKALKILRELLRDHLPLLLLLTHIRHD